MDIFNTVNNRNFEHHWMETMKIIKSIIQLAAGTKKILGCFKNDLRTVR